MGKQFDMVVGYKYLLNMTFWGLFFPSILLKVLIFIFMPHPIFRWLNSRRWFLSTRGRRGRASPALELVLEISSLKLTRNRCWVPERRVRGFYLKYYLKAKHKKELKKIVQLRDYNTHQINTQRVLKIQSLYRLWVLNEITWTLHTKYLHKYILSMKTFTQPR